MMAGFANGTATRRLEAVKLVVRIEQLKEQKERTLDIESILENASKLDDFSRKLPS